MSKIELDRQSFEALASETRVAILKELDHGQRTLAQLSEAFAQDKAGLHRHLEKLIEGGLVHREEHSKWVYYSLTWKGKRLVNPDETTRVVLLLSAAGPLLTVGIVLLVALASPGTIPGIPRADLGLAPAANETGMGREYLLGEEARAAAWELTAGTLAIVLGTLALVIAVLRWQRWSARPRAEEEPAAPPG